LAPTGAEIGKLDTEVCQDRYSIAWNNFINDLFQDKCTAIDLYTKCEPAYTLENDYVPAPPPKVE